MNEVSGAIALWLEAKRRRDRASAVVISVLALGSGTAVFLLMSLFVYTFTSFFLSGFIRSIRWQAAMALGLTALIFFRCMKGLKDDEKLGLDPMGFWILKDIGSVGPRLILEGWRQVRCCAVLGELDVKACAQALAYLAGQNKAVTWQELLEHCAHLASTRLREQLSLLDGVLFLGDDGDRVTLMDPFRVRLRWMLGQDYPAEERQEPTRPKPKPAPQPIPVNEPEKLSAYEILGLSTTASMAEIKAAYRKRVKECHPDLFAGMDQQAKLLAERWTKALNAAYATLKMRHGALKERPGVERAPG